MALPEAREVVSKSTWKLFLRSARKIVLTILLRDKK